MNLKEKDKKKREREREIKGKPAITKDLEIYQLVATS